MNAIFGWISGSGFKTTLGLVGLLGTALTLVSQEKYAEAFAAFSLFLTQLGIRSNQTAVEQKGAIANAVIAKAAGAKASEIEAKITDPAGVPASVVKPVK